MNFHNDSQRCRLILDQLEVSRPLTDKEFNVFTIMVLLNDKNFASLSVADLMQKHQTAVNYILENA